MSLLDSIINKKYLSPSKTNLIKNLYWASLGKVCNLASGLIVGIIVARYLGPEQYGLMNYVISYVFLFQTIAVFGLDSIEVKEEAIPYETEYTYSDEMYKNRSKVVRDGKNGTKELVYTEKYVDGVLADSALTDERVKTDAVSRIVKVGTKANPLPKTLPTSAPMSELTVPSYVNIGANGVPTNYSSVINAKATAYCIPGGTTSTGKRAQAGYIAVDPNEIPYGTEMYIVSADGKYVYGYAIAADTGGFIKSRPTNVDLNFYSEAECNAFGRRNVIIYFL